MIIEIPIIEGLFLNKIKYKINDKEYLSQIYDKEKAKEKQCDVISEGNNIIYCNYDKENCCYILNFGNIEGITII